MKLSGHPLLEALCTEYMLGVLTASVRARFERALSEEREVRVTLASLERHYTPSFDHLEPVEPSSLVWSRIEETLALKPARAAASRIPSQGFIAVIYRLFSGMPKWVPGLYLAVAIMFVGVGTLVLYGVNNDSVPTLIYSSQQGHELELRVQGRSEELFYRTELLANAAGDQVLQLWVIPKGSKKPRSMGVLNSNSGQTIGTHELMSVLIAGGTLAVSVEPKGGSPIDGPTGVVSVLQKV